MIKVSYRQRCNTNTVLSHVIYQYIKKETHCLKQETKITDVKLVQSSLLLSLCTLHDITEGSYIIVCG